VPLVAKCSANMHSSRLSPPSLTPESVPTSSAEQGSLCDSRHSLVLDACARFLRDKCETVIAFVAYRVLVKYLRRISMQKQKAEKCKKEMKQFYNSYIQMLQREIFF